MLSKVAKIFKDVVLFAVASDRAGMTLPEFASVSDFSGFCDVSLELAGGYTAEASIGFGERESYFKVYLQDYGFVGGVHVASVEQLTDLDWLTKKIGYCVSRDEELALIFARAESMELDGEAGVEVRTTARRRI